jgi:hypothetical protein
VLRLPLYQTIGSEAFLLCFVILRFELVSLNASVEALRIIVASPLFHQ